MLISKKVNVKDNNDIFSSWVTFPLDYGNYYEDNLLNKK